MVSFHYLSAVAMLALANSVRGSPIAETSDNLNVLQTRAVIDCGESYRFTTAAQNKGYNDAIAHLDASPPTTVRGSNGKSYPEYYGDNPPVGLPASCKAADVNDLRIYPVFVTEATFVAGMNPGQERVVIARKADGTREKCGIISHRGQASGQFKFCGV
ncbi:hypothetical protein J1614_000064 [Plenodomus biglobosus]|nr:hypothetical protein J1614_000064 [Plenodomus biglobosus]